MTEQRPGPHREFFIGVINAVIVIVLIIVLMLGAIWWFG